MQVYKYNSSALGKYLRFPPPATSVNLKYRNKRSNNFISNYILTRKLVLNI